MFSIFACIFCICIHFLYLHTCRFCFACGCKLCLCFRLSRAFSAFACVFYTHACLLCLHVFSASALRVGPVFSCMFYDFTCFLCLHIFCICILFLYVLVFCICVILSDFACVFCICTKCLPVLLFF